jgi:uncharacterized GH25 family protein
MYRLRLGFSGLVIGLLITTATSAHEFILKPVPVADGKVVVEAVASHAFMTSDEAEAVKDVDVVLMQGGEKSPVALRENTVGKFLQGEAVPGKGPALLLGHRTPQLWSDTTKDVQPGNRKELEAKGFHVLSVGRYEKFAKTLLHATPGDKDVFGAVVGHPLEIVLVTNPADVTAGGTIQCRVLRDGKPVATEVKAGYDGFSAKEDEYAVQTASDSAGSAKFVVSKAGVWFIRVAVTEKLSGADADKVNLRATYAFEVK